MLDSVFDAGNAVKCELAAEVLRSSGHLRLQATGWSMLPTLRPGDTLAIHRAAGDQIRAGDIALVMRDGRLFAHRVVALAGQGERLEIVTQGDGMAHPDPPVGGGQVLGKVSRIVRGRENIEPSTEMRPAARFVAESVRRSDWFARMIVAMFELGQQQQGPPIPCHL